MLQKENLLDSNQFSNSMAGENIPSDLKHKLEIKTRPYLLQQHRRFFNSYILRLKQHTRKT